MSIEKNKSEFIADINFVKFDGKMLMIWSLIASSLFFYSNEVFNISLLYAILFLLSAFVLAVLVKQALLKYTNKTIKLDIYETNFNLIFIYNTVSLFFAFFLSIIFVKIEAIALIYPVWLYSIAIPRFIIGNMSNCGACKSSSIILMFIASNMLLFIFVYTQYINNDLTINILSIVSSITIFIVFMSLGISKIIKYNNAMKLK